MQEIQALSPLQLCWRCDPAQFDFETTEQLDDLSEFVGQTRALDAVRFGITIRREGYNLYVLGPPGVGKRTIVKVLPGAEIGGRAAAGRLVLCQQL